MTQKNRARHSVLDSTVRVTKSSKNSNLNCECITMVYLGVGTRVTHSSALPLLSAPVNRKNGVHQRHVIHRPAKQASGGYGEAVSHLPPPQSAIPMKMAARRILSNSGAISAMEPSKSSHKGMP